MIYNEINGATVNPQGPQKKYLLNLKNSQLCTITGSNYNGYGFQDWTRNYTLTTEQLAEYNELAPKSKKPKKSAQEKAEAAYSAWTKRLVKLTGISVEEAESIADEKLDYQFNKIQEMIERDNERPSIQRNKLIRKMERENPLRRITDENHAQAILAASDRHRNTNYDSLLEEAHELERMGEIEKGTAKEYARTNMQ